jgi:hypothetical protein
MSCYELVVREEYWDMQINTYMQIRGVNLDIQHLKVLKVLIVDYGKRVWEAVQEYAQQVVELFSQMFEAIKDSFVNVVETLKGFIKLCELTFDDDFDVICDKLENKVLYLNKQEYIRNEQYYKRQYKLAKMTYNILHHDRRC